MPTPTDINYKFRTEVYPSDVEAVRDIVVSTGFFRDDEVPVAVSLVEERLKTGNNKRLRIHLPRNGW